MGGRQSSAEAEYSACVVPHIGAKVTVDTAVDIPPPKKKKKNLVSPVLEALTLTSTTVVRLQEIPAGSSYKNSSRLFLDISSCAIMNDLTLTFTSRLKMDAKRVYQE